eukprot:38231-Chlamydomonas_euryale.AAC.9
MTSISSPSLPFLILSPPLIPLTLNAAPRSRRSCTAGAAAGQDHGPPSIAHTLNSPLPPLLPRCACAAGAAAGRDHRGPGCARPR